MSIVIDKFPESYGFSATYGSLPLGYPDKIDKAFCNKIEKRVETVEKNNSASALARQHLRELYPFVNLQFRFGDLLGNKLTLAAREAAKSAGANGFNLRVSNGPKFRSLELSVSFTNDALTRRMQEHEEAEKTLQGQFQEALPVSAAMPLFAGGSNWPDFLCDLYAKRAQVNIVIKEDGWSTSAKSETIAPGL